MAEIVNLRRFRKGKQRADAEAAAKANRAVFGVSKSAKREAQAERELGARRLDAHRLVEPSDSESE